MYIIRAKSNLIIAIFSHHGKNPNIKGDLSPLIWYE